MSWPADCNLGIRILLSSAPRSHLSHAIRRVVKFQPSDWLMRDKYHPLIGYNIREAVFMTRSWLWYRPDLFESWRFPTNSCDSGCGNLASAWLGRHSESETQSHWDLDQRWATQSWFTQLAPLSCSQSDKIFNFSICFTIYNQEYSIMMPDLAPSHCPVVKIQLISMIASGADWCWAILF